MEYQRGSGRKAIGTRSLLPESVSSLRTCPGSRLRYHRSPPACADRRPAARPDRQPAHDRRCCRSRTPGSVSLRGRPATRTDLALIRRRRLSRSGGRTSEACRGVLDIDEARGAHVLLRHHRKRGQHANNEDHGSTPTRKDGRGSVLSPLHRTDPRPRTDATPESPARSSTASTRTKTGCACTATAVARSAADHETSARDSARYDMTSAFGSRPRSSGGPPRASGRTRATRRLDGSGGEQPGGCALLALLKPATRRDLEAQVGRGAIGG